MLKIRKLVRRISGRGKKRAPAAKPFPGVAPYWEGRYSGGGSSGAGSVGRLAEFKAGVLNTFVEQHGIGTVFELGCGDGSQLALARYPSYVGVDVSATAIDLCRKLYASDPSKRFFLASNTKQYEGTYDLVLSLDVIFHLVEDSIYDQYMTDLRQHAKKYVIIYSSNYDDDPEKPWALHVRHRRFSRVFEKLDDQWRLMAKIDNPYPHCPDDPDNTSFADFYVYEKRNAGAEQPR